MANSGFFNELLCFQMISNGFNILEINGFEEIEKFFDPCIFSGLFTAETLCIFIKIFRVFDSGQ